jgi:signal peptide peptidase SppA
MRDFILTNVSHALYGQPWAILPSKLEEIVTAFERRRAGVAADHEQIAKSRDQARLASVEALGGRASTVAGMPVTMVGRTAILPLHGSIVQRPGIFTEYSGGTSAEQFAAAAEVLAHDPGVKSVVWDVDSPGGSVMGLPEAFDRLMAVRGKKKTVAISDSMMCSGGYYLGCAADEVVGTPSSLSGNIGTIMAHADFSKQNERDGVKVTYIHAGKYKSEGNPDEPLTDTAHAALQEMVDDYYGQFVHAVSRARGVSEKAVRTGFGEGRALVGDRAKSAGILDRVETLGSVLKRLGAYESERTVSASHSRLRIAEAELGLSGTSI